MGLSNNQINTFRVIKARPVAFRVLAVIFQRIPRVIGLLKKLRVLDLEENKIEFLPSEIGKYMSTFFGSRTYQMRGLVEAISSLRNDFFQLELRGYKLVRKAWHITFWLSNKTVYPP